VVPTPLAMRMALVPGRDARVPRAVSAMVPAPSSDASAREVRHAMSEDGTVSLDSLRVGDPYIVRADNAALYALLRVSDEETVLVIINLSDAPVSGYTLSLEESGAAPGAYRVPAILGAAEPLAGLTIDENGGFTDYVPLPEIPTYGTVIVQLQFK